MKKIIIGLFMFVFLFGTQTVFASIVWNGTSDDCLGIGSGNFSTGVGIPQNGYDCWARNSYADQSQTAHVQLYYHNNGNEVSTNTRLKISVSPALGQVSLIHTFTGTIISNQGSFPLGSTTLTLTSPQSLTYTDTALFPNQATSASDYYGTEIFNAGLNIGTVTNNWRSQGSAIAEFKISSSYTPPQTSCSISNFQPSSNNIIAGSSVSFTWLSSNCNSFTINGVSATSGSYTDYPYSDKVYTLVGYGLNGSSSPLNTTIYVNSVQNNYCIIDNFEADDTNIKNGDFTYLRWDTTDCDYVTVTELGTLYDTNGSGRIYPNSDTTYTLRAYDFDGSYIIDTVRIYVDEYNNSTPSVSTYLPTYIGETSATISGYANSNSNYSDMDAWLEFSCYGSTKYDKTNNISKTNLSYTISNLAPNTNYSYCTVAQMSDGSIYRGNTVSFTTKNKYVPQPAFIASTTIATNVTKSSAVFHGLVTNTSTSTNTYFEYGTTVYLGSKTTTKSVNNGINIPVSTTISGLKSNTSYFFRLVGESNGAVSRGLIQVFRTTKNGSIVIVQGKTVVAEKSPIMLKIENRYQSVGVRDIIDYTVTYKNIGKNKLTKPIVQVVLPSAVDFVNSSTGTYDLSNRTLSIPLDDLEAGDEGEIYVQGKVNTQVKNNYQIVTTVVLVYTNPNDAQENAIAYVVNNPKNGNSSLGAAAFFANWNLGGLIWWLLITIIIMLAILITRTYRRKNYNNDISKSIR